MSRSVQVTSSTRSRERRAAIRSTKSRYGVRRVIVSLTFVLAGLLAAGCGSLALSPSPSPTSTPSVSIGLSPSSTPSPGTATFPSPTPSPSPIPSPTPSPTLELPVLDVDPKDVALTLSDMPPGFTTLQDETGEWTVQDEAGLFRDPEEHLQRLAEWGWVRGWSSSFERAWSATAQLDARWIRNYISVYYSLDGPVALEDFLRARLASPWEEVSCPAIGDGSVGSKQEWTEGSWTYITYAVLVRVRNVAFWVYVTGLKGGPSFDEAVTFATIVSDRLAQVPRSAAVSVETPTPTPIPSSPTPTSPPQPTSTPTPLPVGTRGNPVPRGQSYLTPDGWQVIVLDFNPDAWPIVYAENQFNDPPGPGNRMVMIRVGATNVSAEDEPAWISDAFFYFVGSHNVLYSTFGEESRCGVIPDDLAEELFRGGYGEGNVCFEIPIDETDLRLLYQYGFDDYVFFAVQ